VPNWVNRGKNATSHSTRNRDASTFNQRVKNSVEWNERVTGGSNWSTYVPASASYSTAQDASSVWADRAYRSGIWTQNEKNVSYYIHWTTATRPSTPHDGMTGHNDDFDGLESYSNGSWRILWGNWTTVTRPDTSTIGTGSKGFNSDVGMGPEIWDGTNWRLL